MDDDRQRREAEEELQQLGIAALERCRQAGADETSLEYLAWLAGLGTIWKAENRNER